MKIIKAIIVVVSVIVIAWFAIAVYYSTPTRLIHKNKIPPQGILGASASGNIEGAINFPSDFIPRDMKICAENIESKEFLCTVDHISDTRFSTGDGYRLEVPIGHYYVFAAYPTIQKNRAYYSEFVTCGLKANICPSHKPIVVEVVKDRVIHNIDVIDWYASIQ